MFCRVCYIPMFISFLGRLPPHHTNLRGFCPATATTRPLPCRRHCVWQFQSCPQFLPPPGCYRYLFLNVYAFTIKSISLPMIERTTRQSSVPHLGYRDNNFNTVINTTPQCICWLSLCFSTVDNSPVKILRFASMRICLSIFLHRMSLLLTYLVSLLLFCFLFLILFLLTQKVWF